MLFTLEIYDTMPNYTDPEGKGTLNADYAQRLKKAFEVYNVTNPADKSKNYTNFDLKKLGDCGKSPYGYISEEEQDGTKLAINPCIFLKMNSVWSWEPEPITAEDFKNNPDWPDSLESHFNNLTKAEKKQVFVDCQGETSVDQEAMKQAVSFFPKTKGFPVKYFPYKGNKEKYQQPLVALQFDGEKMKKFVEVMISVKCKAYYKGGPSQGDFRIRFQHKNF